MNAVFIVLLFQVMFSNYQATIFHFYKPVIQKIIIFYRNNRILALNITKMKQNCALVSKGCLISEESQLINTQCSAQRILCECDASWNAYIRPSPYCVIDFSKVEGKPEYFNTISFFNGACSPSCPKLIEVYYRTQVGEKWEILGKFKLQRHSGWQSFTFNAVPQAKMTLVYVRLAENFRGKEVKLAQLSLSFEQKGVAQLQREVGQLRKELAEVRKGEREVRVENGHLRERMNELERESARSKEIIMWMEKQIRSMMEEKTESEDDFGKLNSSSVEEYRQRQGEGEEEVEKTRELIIEDYELLG